jgi:hypothetical protein
VVFFITCKKVINIPGFNVRGSVISGASFLLVGAAVSLF